MSLKSYCDMDLYTNDNSGSNVPFKKFGQKVYKIKFTLVFTIVIVNKIQIEIKKLIIFSLNKNI